MNDELPPERKPFSRRQLLVISSAGIGVGLARTVLGDTTLAEAAGVSHVEAFNYLIDPLHKAGAYLYAGAPSTTPLESLGFGRTAHGSPQWKVAEWYAKHSIAGAPARRYVPGSIQGLSFAGVGYASSEARIIRGYSGEVWMSIDARSYFGNQPRVPGQQWPNLHLGQSWPVPASARQPIHLTKLRSLVLGLEVRIPYITNYMSPQDYDPTQHTGHSLAYLTVQNQNTASSDHGKYIWFGVPIADYRYDSFPGNVLQDNGHPGSTQQVIVIPPGAEFWVGDIKDGKWHSTRTDLLPLIRQAFSRATSIGYLPNTAWEDLYIGSFDMDWECPGTFAVAMESKPVELLATFI